jgi:hypothetical protein
MVAGLGEAVLSLKLYREDCELFQDIDRSVIQMIDTTPSFDA